jgi:hypothetical protein
MAKSGIDLSLSDGTMHRLGEAGKAQAGVGKYASTGFSGFLDTAEKGLQDIQKGRQEEAKKKQDEADAERKTFEDKVTGIYDGALASGDHMSMLEFGHYDDQLTKLREELLNATDDKSKNMAMKKLNGFITESQGTKQSNIDDADLISGYSSTPADNKSNISSNTDPKWIQLKTDIHQAKEGGNVSIDYDDDGQKVYTVTNPNPIGQGPPDVWTGTMEELDSKMVPRAKGFDTSFGDIAISANAKGGDGSWNPDEEKRQISNNLETKDFESIIHDRLESTGRVFKDDIKENFANYNYVDLLGPDELAGMNIKKDEGEDFWYSNISEADQEALVNAIIDKNDPNWIGEDGQRLVLEDYFFKFANKQAVAGEQKATGKAQVTGELTAQQLDAKQKEWQRLNPGQTWTEIEGTKTR